MATYDGLVKRSNMDDGDRPGRSRSPNSANPKAKNARTEIGKCVKDATSNQFDEVMAGITALSLAVSQGREESKEGDKRIAERMEKQFLEFRNQFDELEGKVDANAEKLGEFGADLVQNRSEMESVLRRLDDLENGGTGSVANGNEWTRVVDATVLKVGTGKGQILEKAIVEKTIARFAKHIGISTKNLRISGENVGNRFNCFFTNDRGSGANAIDRFFGGLREASEQFSLCKTQNAAGEDVQLYFNRDKNRRTIALEIQTKRVGKIL